VLGSAIAVALPATAKLPIRAIAVAARSAFVKDDM
jgi:hypothetical protein